MKPTTIRGELVELVAKIGHDFYKSNYDLEMKHISQAVAQIKSILKSVVGENKESYVIVDSTTKTIYKSFENKGYMKGYNLRGDEINKRIEGEI